MELKREFIDMLERTAALPGGEVLRGLTDALATTDPSVAIRLNVRKLNADNARTNGSAQADSSVVTQTLAGHRRVAWAEHGCYIDGERPRFTMDPAMHQGLYYVQDASSMVTSTIVKQLSKAFCREKSSDEPLVYIDFCAAPGGKTTAAIDALPDGSLVIANEFDRRRAESLRENVVKWGYPSVVVCQGDTSRLARLGAIADIVAVDAPCSGEGMMRKEQAAVEQWSEGLVGQCAALQREILDNAWLSLKPGGYLIYSTCTFNRSEDEENLAYIVETLGGEPVELMQTDDATPLHIGTGIAQGIDTPYPAYRFLPGKIEGEGLFVAVVRKSAEEYCDQRRQKPAKIKTVGSPYPLRNENQFVVEERDGRVIAIPERWAALVGQLCSELNVIHVGIEVATVKGRDYLPSQSLAMSLALDMERCASNEVDYPTAIAYLRGEALRLDDAPRGILLLTYRGYPLGFVKNLGNRANNLYPSAWAIRTSHIPDTPVEILSML